LHLGGTGISPQDSFSYRSNFRFRSSFRSLSSSSSTTSGDIFYCSGSRQLNHSSLFFFVRFFVCPSRYDARHRKPRRCVYSLNLGGTGISTPDNFSYRSNFRFRSSFRFCSRSCSTTSGDIFYCSGSRQLNHSSVRMLLMAVLFNLVHQCLCCVLHNVCCLIAYHLIAAVTCS